MGAVPVFFLVLVGLAAFSAAQKAVYDDDFGRNKMFPIASASYSLEPDLCLGRIFRNFTLARKVIQPCDSYEDTCAAYTALSHDDRAIIISFRGTVGFEQLVNEITHMAIGSLKPFPGGGAVGGYFKDSFDVVWNNGILDSFNLIRKLYPDYELWVTGHSLGGSMASMAALSIAHLSLMDPAKIRLVTFGQPRTGNTAYTEAVDYHLPYSFRVVHDHDAVPHVPLAIMGYAHHQQEVYYPNDMKPGAGHKDCPGDENKKCSDDNTIDASINDHLWYFNHHFVNYGASGCTKDTMIAKSDVHRQQR